MWEINEIPLIFDIPKIELEKFDALIKKHRMFDA
jgi:hypothetical protein